MTSTMLRRCLTAAVALSALAAVVALAPVSSAEARAGGSPSPFAGTYDWTFDGTWAVTISDSGQITGSLVSSFTYTKGSIKGQVSADGSYSFTMSVTGPTFDDPERPPNRGPKTYTVRTTFAGNLASDAGGNMVGTPDTGESFVWLRH